MKKMMLLILLAMGSVFVISNQSDTDVASGQEKRDPQALYRLRWEQSRSTPFPDTDTDDKIDAFDNCPQIFNPKQEDRDLDGVGDICDATCEVAYPQHDYCHVKTVQTVQWWDKGEAFSYYQACNAETPPSSHDFCETGLTHEQYDDDGDRIPNVRDVCPQNIDPEQHDSDRDGMGDACDTNDPCGERRLPCEIVVTEASELQTQDGLALQTVRD